MIVVSKFEPQAKRRARYVKDEIAELGASIALTGQIQPIKVRPIEGGRFEIVYGERRYLACKGNKAKTVLGTVEDLDDEAAFRQMTAENDDRQEPAPVDQAANYSFHRQLLETKRGSAVSVEELAEILGKSVSHVAGRLKLDQLIDEAKADIEEGYLPIGHGLEIAKYAPETQQLIYAKYVYRETWTGNSYGPDKTAVVSLSRLSEMIRGNVLLALSSALFDLKATDLREDGLACVKCPSRTGANASLFEKDLLGKNDSCLDRICFGKKTGEHIHKRRAAIAVDAGKEIADVAYVHTHSYASTTDYLGLDSFQLLDSEKGSPEWCEHKEIAINVVQNWSHSLGAEVFICRNRQCETHYGNTSSTTPAASTKPVKSAEEIAAEEALRKANENEERFDIKVGQAVRKRVFRQAAEKFGEHVKEYAVDEIFSVTDVVHRLLERSEYPHNQLVNEICAEWDINLNPSQIAGARIAGRSLDAILQSLSLEEQARLMFLLTYSHLGAMYAKSWVSQKPVKEIADKWGIDYRRLDAAERMNFARKADKDRFRKYLDALDAGETDSKLPRQYSREYKAKE